MSEAVDELVWQLRAASLPTPEMEYRFHPERRWRFDLAWPDLKVAVEVDGGGFVQGRHSRGMGIERDSEKFSTSAAHGWRVFRVTPRMVRDGAALALIEKGLGR
jgi:very-short-patch-repair endonuclease